MEHISFDYLDKNIKDLSNYWMLTIPGEPIAKARARIYYNPKMGHAMAYTPKKTATYEQYIKLIAKDHFDQPIEGAISVSIRVYRSMPKAFSKKKAAEAENKVIFPTTKPDCSNYQKSVEDALNGIAFKDDSQIVSVWTQKFYSQTPRTEIEIWKL